MDVIIVGGGIGGLTLALYLHRAGISCRVYEAAPELKAVGVGVSLWTGFWIWLVTGAIVCLAAGEIMRPPGED